MGVTINIKSTTTEQGGGAKCIPLAPNLLKPDDLDLNVKVTFPNAFEWDF